MNAPRPLEAKVAVVTGGSQGIGYACAKELICQGMRVALIARTETKLARAARELAHGCVYVVADVSNPGTAERAIDEVVDRFGALDVIVNAHGVIPAEAEFPDVPTEVWDYVLGTNLRGVINMGRVAARRMRENGSGVIINISSVDADVPAPLMSPYTTSKGAIGALTRSMAYDLGKHGVRVVGVEPGWVRTPMTEDYLAPLAGRWLEGNMLGRFAEPSEIASVVGFLAGPGASYVTGTMVRVDGGHSGTLALLRAADP
jgi:meso-butanediol dehydrogenase/(S,S)-butanediol dehydrogenase/diacetyl reductase